MIRIKRLLNKDPNNEQSIVRDRSNILNTHSPFFTVEEYKALRTNLTFCIPSSECKIIGITSAEAKEGKSMTCINLALAFAETKHGY